MTSPDTPIDSADAPFGDPDAWRRNTRALRRIARSIVGDDQADDVVQETWVRALETRASAPPFAWLRRVLRNRSIDRLRRQRIRAHETLQEDPVESGTDAASAHARLDVQRAVLDAVRSLDEPYRTTIYLRYFDECTPSEIADRTQTPLKTVKTRLTRAHAQLRRRLERDHAGRGAWSAAFVAFAGHETATKVASATPILLATTTMKKLSIAIVSVLVLVAGWFLAVSTDAGPGALGDGRTDVVAAADGDAARLASGHANETLGSASLAGSPGTERTVVADGTERPELVTGSLRVKVLDAQGAPIEGIHVIVEETFAPMSRRFRRTSDAHGVAFFPRLPVGTVNMSTVRTAWTQIGAARIARDETEEVEIRLFDGVDVAGHVVDPEGNPVAGASILTVSGRHGWADGAVLTHTDAHGTFRLRQVQSMQSIGAIADGYQPSALFDLDRTSAARSALEIELVLARGGATVVGQVLDTDRRPIADAIVVVGKSRGRYIQTRADGSVEEVAPPRATRTDADGRFRIVGLAVGEDIRIQARALGYAPWRSTVTLKPADVVTRSITLLQGATLTGVVRDTEGRPLADAAVRVFSEPLSESFLQHGQVDYTGLFSHAAVRTDESGHYRVDWLPPGPLYAYAQEPDETPEQDVVDPMQKVAGRKKTMFRYTRAVFDAHDGQTIEWSPRIEDGRVIAGSVRFRDGTPVPDVFVSAVDPTGGDTDRRATRTKDGDFRLIQLRGASYDVRVQLHDLPDGVQAPSLFGVAPDGDPIELIVDCDAPNPGDRATVVARFVDAAERAGESRVRVKLERVEGRGGVTGRKRDEDWTFTVPEPGRYRAVAIADERILGASDIFDVLAGDHLDIGTFESRPGGTLVLEVEAADDPAPSGVRAFLTIGDFAQVQRLDLQPGTLRLEGLQPGRARISWVGDNVTQSSTSFELHSGAETDATLELTAAVRVPYHILWNAEDAPGSLAIRVVDLADGTLADSFDHADANRYTSPIRWSTFLPVGEYAFEVELGNGQRHRERFRVRSLHDTFSDPLTADLR